MLDREFKNLREGQVLFNFLAWIFEEKSVADIFHNSDEKLNKWWGEYLEIIKGEIKNYDNNK